MEDPTLLLGAQEAAEEEGIETGEGQDQEIVTAALGLGLDLDLAIGAHVIAIVATEEIRPLEAEAEVALGKTTESPGAVPRADLDPKVDQGLDPNVDAAGNNLINSSQS